jgi:hypothetical protein
MFPGPLSSKGSGNVARPMISASDSHFYMENPLLEEGLYSLKEKIKQ